MTHFMAQVALQDASGLARDRYVNTFHLESTGFTEGELDGLVAAFHAFYTDSASEAHSIDHYLARHAIFSPAVIKIYDMANAIPRKPIRIDTFALNENTDGSIALPAEVACCISFKGPVASGQPVSRGRGRIYIGPLNTKAPENEAPQLKARPNEDMRTEFVAHFAVLMQAIRDVTGDWELRQFSAKTGVLHPITEIWCDDAWDIQRRRGAEPSSRVTVLFT